MDRKLEKIARAGYVAKGSIYAITGILTLLAALNLGGQKTGQNQVLEYLDTQPFGNALLILLGLGLVGYSIWRFAQAISDTENLGSDKKAKFQRLAYFISGCSYLILGVLAFMQLMEMGSSGGSEEKSSFLATNTGLSFLGIVGGIFIGRGLYQFLRMKSRKFLRKFESGTMIDKKRRKIIKNSAYMGLTSRGILFTIIGYFFLYAALTSNPSEVKDTKEVFSFLEEQAYGPWLLGFVAAGLVGYSIFTFMMARFRDFNGGE